MLRYQSEALGPILADPYAVPRRILERYSYIPELDYSKTFRSELSAALSVLLFLEPDAVVASYFDRAPLLSYFDPVAYNFADLLYPVEQDPFKDLDRCSRANSLAWADKFRQAGLF